MSLGSGRSFALASSVDRIPPQEPRTRDYLTIGLISAAAMIYQIALTRILSVVVWYHFAFLAVSMVMLGLGAPGIWLAFATRPARYLAGLLVAGGLSIPLSTIAIVQWGARLHAGSIAFIIICVLPVTLSLGGAICILLMRASGRQVARIYGADLLGAGLAAAIVVPLLHGIPTPLLAAGLGFLPLGCSVLYSKRLRIVSLTLAALLGGAIAHGELFRVTHSKTYDEEQVKPLYERWSPTARITVFDDRSFPGGRGYGFSWGPGTKYPTDTQARTLWLEQDGSAGTPITGYHGDLADVEHLLFDVTSVGYQLRPPTKVAIVGAGGGRDILSALLAGAADIDAIELNGYTIDAVSERFSELSGDIYHAPGVRAITDEGRSFLTSSDGAFDLIQISLIDSWAASMAGAFALAENNLYTVEAFELYTERLSSGGLISTSRWLTETPRLTVLALTALDAIGVADPKRHIAVVSAGKVATVLTAKSGFEAQDILRLDAICEERGFTRLYPVLAGEQPVSRVVARAIEDRGASLAEFGLHVDAPTDDSPYFFQVVSPFTDPARLDNVAVPAGLQFNRKSTAVLRQAMILVSGLGLLLFLAPFLARFSAKQRSGSVGQLMRASLYFAAIGAAFMLLENMLIQKFVLYLGHPSFAVTVILASLLTGMGAGSALAERVGLERLRAYGFLVAIAMASITMALPGLFSATLGLALPLRIGITAMLLAPLGAMLGVFFPLGMLHFGDQSKPWYWAINGAFGVVASVMSLALSMQYGFTAVGLIAASGYLLAWACLGPGVHRQ